MRFAIFCHSIISDWNHGNAHFLRGVATELQARGHEVRVFEPHDSWSLTNLTAEHGEEPVRRFEKLFPNLIPVRYEPSSLDMDDAMDGCDAVLVHEWNAHELVARIGCHHVKAGRYRLFFHDTHHRSVTDRESMARYNLSGYDGVLAFGEVIRERYVSEGWSRRAWTWHEAADIRICSAPGSAATKSGDLVWVGNWGDNERTKELQEFLLDPVRDLNLSARVHGVRYPAQALEALRQSGIEFAGWVPNYDVPAVFSEFRATVHVPRGPYVRALQGIPTIRVFEALACGIPLVSAPWQDSENLFTPDRDFLLARSGAAMRRILRDLMNDSAMRAEFARRGRETILARHTCGHRVDQLLDIVTCLNN